MGSVVFNGKSVRPGKVVCVGKNYAAHIEEMASVPAENMVVFMKPATSIGTELFAALDEPLHYEGEICLLIQGGKVAGLPPSLPVSGGRSHPRSAEAHRVPRTTQYRSTSPAS